MVYFTSNLSIDGLLAFILIGSSLRSKFLKSNWTKGLFILANIFAIVPDFDVFIGEIFGIKNHRGLSHSIFFPLVFIIIGLIFLLYNKIQSKKDSSSLLDVDSLFDQASDKNNTKGQILYLLPYFFILISFYWGMHIILDMDSYEGGMMLLWPFDNTLYEIFLNFKFSPYPFLILPWTPLGASLSFQQSNVSGLLNYMFNWTPQELINYYNSPTFQYAFVGLILNILLVIIWLYFIVKPFWPFQGLHIGQKFNVFSIFTKIKHYWKKISKELLVPGIILLLIGFTLGPLITSQVANSQSLQDNLQFTGNSFQGLSYIPIDSITQPLDPNAQFLISIDYNLTNVHLGDSIYFIVASNNFFEELSQKMSNSLSKLQSNTTNDVNFKNNYLTNVDSFITNQSTIYEQVQQTNQTNFSFQTRLKTMDNYGMGFVLKDWVSKSNLNETNTQLYIKGSFSISYTRDINYLVGVSIEIIGIAFVLVALSLPYKK